MVLKIPDGFEIYKTFHSKAFKNDQSDIFGMQEYHVATLTK
jgi:hypothetical protein